MPTCIYCGDEFDTRKGMKIHQGQKHDSEQPKYEQLHPPKKKSKSEYSTLERRTELFQKWMSKGSWSRINQMDQAKKYDVHPTQITHDRRTLEDYVLNNERLQEEIRANSLVAYQTIIDKSMSQREYGEARRALDSLNEFLERRGKEENQSEGGDTNIVVNNQSVKVNLVEAVESNLGEARKKIARGEWPGIDTKAKDDRKVEAED